MFDACHSGSVLDLGWEMTREGIWARSKDARNHTTTPEDKYTIVCLSGAQDYQCALETAGGGNMTNKFLATSRSSMALTALNASFYSMSLQCPRISASAPVDPKTAFALGCVPQQEPAPAPAPPQSATRKLPHRFSLQSHQTGQLPNTSPCDILQRLKLTRGGRPQ